MEQILPRLLLRRQPDTVRPVASPRGTRPFAPYPYKAGGRVGPEHIAGRGSELPQRGVL